MAKRKTIEHSKGTGQNGHATLPYKRQRKANEELIDKANTIPIDDFITQHVDNNALLYSAGELASTRDFRITLKAAKDLSKPELNGCFELIESTSRPDYESSSWGWHPKRKKHEMKEDEMRYMLVRECSAGKQPDDSASLDGFLSFMLTHDSTPSVPVLYIYEIHLSQTLRKLRLGSHLMDVAEGIAESVGVEKVMLTCFLSNDKARGFYKRRGYVTDVCSPEDRTTRNKVVMADYIIMSKPVGDKRSTSAVTSADDNVRDVSNKFEVTMSGQEADKKLADGTERESYMNFAGVSTVGASQSCDNDDSMNRPGEASRISLHGDVKAVDKENNPPSVITQHKKVQRTWT